jgi:hypothetical protein
MVKVQRGTLLSSDEATVTFLLLLDERSVGGNKFIVARLDSRNLLIKSDRVPAVKEAIAGRLADVAIVTDDNPRSEDPAAIRKAVKAGCPAAREIGDRRAAIREAIEMMGDGDVVIIAGKGHEQGQIVGGVTHPFDDATEAAEALRIHA